MATNTNPFYTYSATAGSSKTLQKPQDGGDNNQWGNYINTDLDEIVAAVNALSDKIADANEKTLVDFTATGSAVNHIGITNATTGNPPQISSAGSDTNVDLTLTAKGTGDINLTPGTNGDVNIPASKGITFGDDGEKIEGDGTDLTIASSNDLNLTATTDINVPADVGLTFGDDGEKIEGDGTNLTIASSATLNVNTGSASGNDLKVNTSQLVVEGDTGRVGVGTATPSQQIHISGDTPIIQLTDTTTGADSLITASNSTGSLKIQCDNNNESGSSTFEVDIDGSQQMKVDSNGDMTITNGNLVISNASDKGITFQSAGGTGTSSENNTLSEYERGTFVAKVQGTTSGSTATSSTTSQYERIGNLVYIHIRMSASINFSSLSGEMLVTGLPFNSFSDSKTMGVCWHLGVTSNVIFPWLDTNTNQLKFLIQNSGSPQGVGTSTAAYLYVTIAYLTS